MATLSIGVSVPGADITRTRSFPDAKVPIVRDYIMSDRRWNGHDEVVQDPDIQVGTDENGDPIMQTPPPRTVRIQHTAAEAFTAWCEDIGSGLFKAALAHNRAVIQAAKDAEGNAAADADEFDAPIV
jgi:hypothetical protein